MIIEDINILKRKNLLEKTDFQSHMLTISALVAAALCTLENMLFIFDIMLGFISSIISLRLCGVICG